MPVRDRTSRACRAALLALLLALFTVPQSASAASLTQVTGFGSNPVGLSMYTYVPDNLSSGAPVVVALRGCPRSASDYCSHSGWPKYADLYGFALVFPQTSSANNADSCFNWYQSADCTRGQGEALSIDSGIPAGCATALSSGLTCEYNPVSPTTVGRPGPQRIGRLERTLAAGGRLTGFRRFDRQPRQRHRVPRPVDERLEHQPDPVIDHHPHRRHHPGHLR